MSITGGYLAQGDRFRLYQEMFDAENVHLRLDGAEFEATQNRITVKIPKQVWEVIRQKGFNPEYCHFELDKNVAIVRQEGETYE